MSLTEILILSLGLAMDAFAVSVTSGFTLRNPKVRQALKIGLFFGGFQSLMPLVGWAAGTGLRTVIRDVDHWVAFGLLCFIGVKMMAEALYGHSGGEEKNPLDLWVLLVLSVATSVDALAAGISFAFLKISVIFPVFMIGLITFLLSSLGVLIGKRFGHHLEDKLRVLGGIILIGIGIKILIEHLSA